MLAPPVLPIDAWMAYPRYYLATLRLMIGRIAVPVSLLLLVFSAGTLGYWTIGYYHQRAWSLLDCAYMTSITLTTVGYSDVLGVSEMTSGRIYTMLLVVTGLGVTLYSVSTMTAFIVEGHVRRAFEEKRMESRIAHLAGHTIICGCGLTGRTVAEEHANEGRSFVVIDSNEARLKDMAEHVSDALYLVADATSEEVVKLAGLERAGCLVATLGDDKANMFLVVTGRFLNKSVRIVTSCSEHDHALKFRAAGADHVVSTNFIGGLRIASHVLQPTVVDFLDAVRGDQSTGRLSELVIGAKSDLSGQTLASAKLGVTVLAMRSPSDTSFQYAPRADAKLAAGTTLVLIGTPENLGELRRRCAGEA